MASKSPVGLEDRFEDVDDEDVYARVKAEAASDKATNFVVEFNFHESRIAFNLRSEDFGKQLSKPNDIESVSMCNENKVQPSARATSQSSENLEIYQMIKETVNYTSIDRGKQCRDNEEPPRVLPPWHWSWLTLCSDSVVVSFHETPPTEHLERDDWARDELRSMRSNTLSVLSKLSKHGVTDFSHRLVSFKRVRQAMTETEPQSDTAYEGSSNLFYYLTEEAKPRRTMSLSFCTKSLYGEVNISSSARSRFERLRDRLRLLMLNTIQGCLEEQKALSDMYFSLTAQKDSQATARLSRSATLLAKLSVFFLPITIMTSYFSFEIPDVVEHYTPKTHWICFAVIAGLSFISLFFFSRMLEAVSDTLEGWADYVS
ncbi:ADP-ribosylation factor [Colletotrichum navitas]|uniref:ADP-ribosylation factor n=1 Tax=Colletotrichum navitas TaxID=681940 RepID=A0AAD8VAD1_9PEZI|nr:ADP-ribosylation factor [Colletotrichum navitas]KAK1598083.1 ADP-ribosylation factor [Colletotrichum navitas]